MIADNAVFLISDPDFPGEDEFAENGLPSPDFTAKTPITAKSQPAFALGGHLYFQATPWLAPGVQASYAFEREFSIQSSGVFDVPIYRVLYKAHQSQVHASVRLGGWIETVRPFVTVGGGPYWIHEEVTAELNDPDDPDHTPLTAGEANHSYMSARLGGGFDWKAGPTNVGFMVAYQRVFSPGKNLDFLVPTLTFSAQF